MKIWFAVLCLMLVPTAAQAQRILGRRTVASPPCKTSPSHVYPAAAKTAAKTPQPAPTPNPAPAPLALDTIAGLPAAVVKYPTEANLPKLAEALRTHRGNPAVRDAMADLGEVAAPFLAEIVADEEADWFARRQATIGLGIIGPPAKSGAAALQKVISSTDGETKAAPRLQNAMARVALASIEDDMPAMIEVIQKWKRNPLVLAVLLRIGDRGKPVIDDLVLLYDEIPERYQPALYQVIEASDPSAVARLKQAS